MRSLGSSCPILPLHFWHVASRPFLSLFAPVRGCSSIYLRTTAPAGCSMMPGVRDRAAVRPLPLRAAATPRPPRAPRAAAPAAAVCPPAAASPRRRAARSPPPSRPLRVRGSLQWRPRRRPRPRLPCPRPTPPPRCPPPLRSACPPPSPHRRACRGRAAAGVCGAGQRDDEWLVVPAQAAGRRLQRALRVAGDGANRFRGASQRASACAAPAVRYHTSAGSVRGQTLRLRDGTPNTRAGRTR